MDSNQIAHINSKLPALIEMTDCNNAFLTRLIPLGVLTKSECDSVNSKPTKDDRAYELFSIVTTRTDAYQSLIIAYEATGQTGAAKILRLLDNNDSPLLNTNQLRPRLRNEPNVEVDGGLWSQMTPQQAQDLIQEHYSELIDVFRLKPSNMKTLAIFISAKILGLGDANNFQNEAKEAKQDIICNLKNSRVYYSSDPAKCLGLLCNLEGQDMVNYRTHFRRILLTST